jgi:hypothetical protein
MIHVSQRTERDVFVPAICDRLATTAAIFQ